MTVQICCITNRKRVKRLTIIKNGYIIEHKEGGMPYAL